MFSGDRERGRPEKAAVLNESGIAENRNIVVRRHKMEEIVIHAE